MKGNNVSFFNNFTLTLESFLTFQQVWSEQLSFYVQPSNVVVSHSIWLMTSLLLCIVWWPNHFPVFSIFWLLQWLENFFLLTQHNQAT